MTRSLLHDTHTHLEMLLEKLKIGENFRDYEYSKKPQNQISLENRGICTHWLQCA